MKRVLGGKLERADVLVTGDTMYEEVAFKGSTFIARKETPGFVFINCSFIACTFVYDGMEVAFEEWITLLRRKPDGGQANPA